MEPEKEQQIKLKVIVREIIKIKLCIKLRAEKSKGKVGKKSGYCKNKIKLVNSKPD